MKVEEGLGLVTYTALFAPDSPLDGPPTDADLHIPPREAEIVSRVAADLQLASSPATEKIRTIAAYFRRKFEVDILKEFKEAFDSLVAEGVASVNGDEVKLTCEGLLKVDTLLPRFFEPEHRGIRYT